MMLRLEPYKGPYYYITCSDGMQFGIRFWFGDVRRPYHVRTKKQRRKARRRQ